MKKKIPDVEVGVAWYKPEHWALLKAYAVDSNELEDTFPEWLEMANRSYKMMEDEGLSLRKVVVDVDALFEWCKKKNIPLNGEARSEYASVLLKKMNK